MRKAQSTYDKDFYKWSLMQATFLKKKEFDKLDLENVIEEIESLGQNKHDALESHLIVLMKHKLKIDFQSYIYEDREPKSWLKSVFNAQISIEKLLDKNPLLKNGISDVVIKSYYYARKEAHIETDLEIDTFPEECPWTFKELMKGM